MRLPAPASIAGPLADLAAKKAREDITGRGWQSSGALQPVFADGEVGIRSTMKHLIHQNQGFGPFVMWWVRDRKVPLGCKQGDGPHFRTGVGVGTPGYVDIPHVGKVWRDVRWQHPGLKPKRFLEKSIAGAVRESRDTIQQQLLAILSGGDPS